MSDILTREEVAQLRTQIARLTEERDEARAEAERLRDSLATIIDEAWGMQPCMPTDALLTELERRLHADHRVRERLRGALEALSTAERHYRDMYQRHGGQALDTGRAWDMLRKAGIEARAALAKVKETNHTLDSERDRDRAQVARLTEVQGDLTKALIDIGHEILGCDGHPCRVESMPLHHAKDIIAQVRRLGQEITRLTEQRDKERAKVGEVSRDNDRLRSTFFAYRADNYHLRALLEEARNLIVASRLVLGDYQGPREVSSLTTRIDAELAKEDRG